MKGKKMNKEYLHTLEEWILFIPFAALMICAAIRIIKRMFDY